MSGSCHDYDKPHDYDCKPHDYDCKPHDYDNKSCHPCEGGEKPLIGVCADIDVGCLSVKADLHCG